MGGDYRERTETVASPDMHATTCTRSGPRWRSKISTRSADDNILDVMALPPWPTLQPLDRCPHADFGFYDGAWSGPNSVVPRIFTMSQLHLRTDIYRDDPFSVVIGGLHVCLRVTVMSESGKGRAHTNGTTGIGILPVLALRERRRSTRSCAH